MAKREYLCIWCPEKIKAGEKYVRLVGVYDGEFQSNEFHPECHKAMERFFAENRDETEFMPHECKRGTNEEYHPPPRLNAPSESAPL